MRPGCPWTASSASQAERAWAADQARGTVLRRENGEETLDDLVTEALGGGSVDWDAWRREDGRWSIMAMFRQNGADRRATWLFDPRSRSVHADDDEAHSLAAPEKVVPLRRQQTVVVEREVEEIVVVEEATVTEISPSRDDEPPTKGRKSRRASVPSWDEILFGAGQGDT